MATTVKDPNTVRTKTGKSNAIVMSFLIMVDMYSHQFIVCRLNLQ